MLLSVFIIDHRYRRSLPNTYKQYHWLDNHTVPLRLTRKLTLCRAQIGLHEPKTTGPSSRTVSALISGLTPFHHCFASNNALSCCLTYAQKPITQQPARQLGRTWHLLTHLVHGEYSTLRAANSQGLARWMKDRQTLPR